MSTDQFESIRSVLKAHQNALMAKPNVVGVGIGFRETHGVRTDTVGIVVLVSHKFPAAELSPEALLPTELDGIPVDVQEVGKVAAQS